MTHGDFRTITVKSRTYDIILKAAKQDNRSMANYIENIFEKLA